MKFESYLSKDIKIALQNDPPGEWMPQLTEKCIRLSSGYPAPDLVPYEELKLAVSRLLDDEQDLPLQYIGSPRVPKLNEQIKERLSIRGIYVAEAELLITSGACQAIDLIARILLDEDSVVAIEAPTYMEALEIFHNYTQNFMSIPVDENGINTDLFGKRLSIRKAKGLTLPRFLYTIPTFQNPTGTTMTLERRLQLLKLASKYDFLIVEDDAYGELSFHEIPRPLKAMDKELRVLYLGSFSKVVAPGMRIGWVAGAKEFIKTLAWFKKDLDHPFAQAIMATFLENNDFGGRLKFLRKSYQKKYDLMISELERNLPDSISWYVTEGGYFVWVKIPDVDTSQLLTRALSEGVSYIPGKYFFLNKEEGRDFLRLSFSYASEQDIVLGIQKLGKAITSFLKRN